MTCKEGHEAFFAGTASADINRWTSSRPDGDTGGFWFFSPSNLEVLIKVLNGCGVKARYWTFAGGLTNVNVILTVTDTQTGTIQTYTNPQGTPFEPIQDTNAFATCP